MITRRSKATDVSSKVRKQVFERDNNRCVMCGSHSMLTAAHYISRAKGGLGIPENLVTLCIDCHHDFDNGRSKERADIIKERMKEHLVLHYTYWDENKLKYKKWG